ncbi:MAG: GTPase HflX, partial [Nitrosomonas sp.]
IDHVGDATAQAECETALHTRYPDCIVMSARRPGDVAKLRLKILEFFQQNLVEAELFLPWSAQQLRGAIYTNCQVLAEHSDNEGTFFRVRSESATIENLREQFSRAS